ncbi:hypothetical protein ACWGXJ_04555 [Paenibacillus sp. S33]
MDYEILHLGLKQKINSTQDFILFDEVLGCLKGHSFRAAYIINWICIAESIKNKFKDMAKRDGEINKNVVGVVEHKEENKQQTDRFLLDKAEEYGIIDQEEFMKLEHMCNMRGMYAHPIGNSPTQDEVITAIKIGVDAVLSKTPLFKHGYAQKIVISLYEDLHYIDNELNTILDFSYKTFTHLHSTIYFYLVDQSFKRLDPIIFDPADAFWYRGINFTNHFVSLVSEKIDLNTTWDLRTLITKYPKASCAVFLNSVLWPKFENDIQDLIISHSLEPLNESKDVVAPSKFSVENVYNLIATGSISKERHLQKYREVISKINYSVKKDYNIPLELYIDEIIEDLKIHDWYLQNPAVRTIYSIHINKLSELPYEKQTVLGRNIMQSAEGNANVAKEYINDLHNSLITAPPYVIKGIVEETFYNEDGKIRFKTRQLRESLLTLKAVEKEFALSFLTDIRDILQRKEYKYPWVHESEEVLRIIDRIIKERIFPEEATEKLSEVVESVNLIFQDMNDKFS